MRARLIHSRTTLLVTVLLRGLIAAALVRRLPGFGVDEPLWGNLFAGLQKWTR